MNTPHRRRSERIEVSGTVSCLVHTRDGHVQPVELINLSLGGMMLRSPAPVAGLGELIEVELHFGKSARFRSQVKVVDLDPVEAEAFEGRSDKVVIRWIDPRGGSFGVEFTELDDHKQRVLKRILDALE